MVALQNVPPYLILLASNTFYFLFATTDDPIALFVHSTVSQISRILGLGYMRTKEVSGMFYLGMAHIFMEYIKISQEILNPLLLHWSLLYIFHQQTKIITPNFLGNVG